MKIDGSATSEWGFQQPSPGWHTVEFGEDFKFMKKDGEVVTDKNQKKRYIIPSIIVSPGDDEGKNLDNVISFDTPFGAKVLGDILAATGLKESFEKNFPEDATLWDKEVQKKIAERLPGKRVKYNIEYTSKSKYPNFIAIAPANSIAPPAPKKKKVEPPEDHSDGDVPW